MSEAGVDVRKLASDLEAIVGEENVSTNIYDRLVYAHDVFPYDLEENEIPYVVVWPKSTEEVSKILIYANNHKIPVHVNGSVTALHGSARPKCKCILLNTSRLRFLELNEEAHYVECGAGVRVLELAQMLEEKGYFLPMIPGSRIIATIGGLIAVNTSGHGVDSCLGKPGDYVLGLEVVLPTGEIIETGTKGLRRPSGMELTRLFVGSEGLLGVITKARIRLLPKPEHAYGIAFFDEPVKIARAVQRVYTSKSPYPLFIELLDKKSASVGFEVQQLGMPKGDVALIETIGWSSSEAEWKIKRILEAFEKEKPLEIFTVEGKQQWEKYWTAREVIVAYIQRKGPMIVTEIAPPLPKLDEAMVKAYEMPEKMETIKNLDMYLMGHIGSPTLHQVFVLPRGLSNEVKRKVVREIRKKSEELNSEYDGCGGEWGVTAQRVYFLRKRYGETYFSILLKIKNLLDPNNILNRGNLEERW